MATSQVTTRILRRLLASGVNTRAERLLARMPPADVAPLLSGLTREELRVVIELLFRLRRAARVLRELPHEMLPSVFDTLTDQRLATPKESQIAGPANTAASPSKAKTPAPTIEPTPSAIALRTVTVRRLTKVLSHKVDRKAPTRDEVSGRGGITHICRLSLLAPTYLPASEAAGW